MMARGTRHEEIIVGLDVGTTKICAVVGEVVRLRAKMGTLKGRALVDGKVVCEGQMTFALAPRAGGSAPPEAT